jgi:hypothetical protein
MSNITLSDIETAARDYAKARKILADRVGSLEDELGALKRRRIDGIKSATEEAAGLCDRLRTMVEGAPGLFEKPRTYVLHGIKLGFMKGKGKLDWDDSAAVIAKIRKHLGDQADVLVIIEERPSADAMKNLPASDLARIGVRLIDADDQVIVKATDSEVDKFVSQLLKEGLKPVEG